MSFTGNIRIGADSGILNALSASRISPRIVGGRVVPSGKYPWMAALFYRDCSPSSCQFCGGSLVRPNRIATAAHCAAALGANTPIDVFIGQEKLSNQGEVLQVSEFIVHPDFNPNTLDNDLAVLKLASASSFQPIDLIASSDPDNLTAPGSRVTAIGWGATSQGGPGSLDLMEIDVPVIANSVAAVEYQKLGSTITDNMLAAGLPQGGGDACQGDSGGPLISFARNAQNSTVPILVGVTSWGIGCARPKLPGLYTRLANYWDWLQDTLQ